MLAQVRQLSSLPMPLVVVAPEIKDFGGRIMILVQPRHDTRTITERIMVCA